MLVFNTILHLCRFLTWQFMQIGLFQIQKIVVCTSRGCKKYLYVYVVTYLVSCSIKSVKYSGLLFCEHIYEFRIVFKIIDIVNLLYRKSLRSCCVFTAKLRNIFIQLFGCTFDLVILKYFHANQSYLCYCFRIRFLCFNKCALISTEDLPHA